MSSRISHHVYSHHKKPIRSIRLDINEQLKIHHHPKCQPICVNKELMDNHKRKRLIEKSAIFSISYIIILLIVMFKPINQYIVFENNQKIKNKHNHVNSDVSENSIQSVLELKAVAIRTRLSKMISMKHLTKYDNEVIIGLKTRLDLLEVELTKECLNQNKKQTGEFIHEQTDRTNKGSH